MINFRYENIINITLERFPEFRDSQEFKNLTLDADLPYIFYGWFKQFIFKKLENYGEKDLIIVKFISFINELFNDPNADQKSLSLVKIELLEPLRIPGRNVKFARKNFSGKALEAFELALKSRVEACKKYSQHY